MITEHIPLPDRITKKFNLWVNAGNQLRYQAEGITGCPSVTLADFRMYHEASAAFIEMNTRIMVALALQS